MAYKKAIMARPPMIMAIGADLATPELVVCSATGGIVLLGVVWLPLGAGTGATGLDCKVVGTGAGGASDVGGGGEASETGADGLGASGLGASGLGASGLGSSGLGAGRDGLGTTETVSYTAGVVTGVSGFGGGTSGVSCGAWGCSG